MSKKILLIESDAPFAEELASTLEARGLEVRTTGDGREGYDLAKEWGPDAIVLCVELPGMSGYVICQKLKKDDALRSLPLVLTSAEATEETFEHIFEGLKKMDPIPNVYFGGIGEPNEYVLKWRGFEVLDEQAPVTVAGAREGSTFLLTYRLRRPVR